ncbi:hypothetical protein MS6204_00602 [Escherichia coli]|nr:hypothetical protein [Escherichia coli]
MQLYKFIHHQLIQRINQLVLLMERYMSFTVRTLNRPPRMSGALPITGGNLNGGLTATGEIISKSANGLRIAYGNYGFFIRNDGSNTYFMLTDSGNSLGTYNRLRPLIINNANGAVTIGNGLNVTGGINGSLNGNAATATKLQTGTHNRRRVIRWLRQYQPAGCKHCW